MVEANAHVAPEEIIMIPGEIDKRSIDFATQLANGQTISSVTSVTAAATTGSGTVTVSGNAVSGSKVTFDLDTTAAGGGDVYRVTATIVTSDAKIKIGMGDLYVQN